MAEHRFQADAEGLAALQRALKVRPASATEQPRRWLTTGVSEVDDILGGGWARGKITEVTGPRSSGRTGLLLASVAALTGRGEIAAWIDPTSALDIRALSEAGVVLPRILWVRPHTARECLSAAEMVLGVDGFSLVVIDFSEPLVSRAPVNERIRPPRSGRKGDTLSDGAWARLSRAAERSEAVVVVLAEEHLCGTFAAVTLSLEPMARAWCGISTRRAVLDGVVTKARVARSKIGCPEQTALLHLRGTGR